MRPLGVVVLLGGLLALPGCLFDGCGGYDHDEYWDSWPPDASVPFRPDASLPPSFTAIEVPSYPPLGPTGVVTVTLHDDTGLSALGYEFAKVGQTWISGTNQTVTIPAAALGEGFGDLQLTVSNVRGAWTRKVVENLVVDFSPPKVEVMPRSLMRPGDEVVAWVSDGWLLGSVELKIGDLHRREDFPQVYPPYFGQQWDLSLVRFPIGDLADGTHRALLVVKDAAGNEVKEEFDLTIDGVPPTLSIRSPTPGATVNGHFPVEVEADDGGGEVGIVLRVDGIEIASATGPAATIYLDADDFAPGTVDLEVEALDAAGNSTFLTLPLVVAP
ncbi:MAG: Ig-like domain-containing protein [Deltaproteobacteria bacterium]|nr:Ig-like domain-containing protein [Deltaproteobacteria bacterium]